MKSTQAPDLQALGSLVRERRRDLGLTQVQLGTRLGWAQERVSAVENGRYGMPSLPLLAQLAQALETSLTDVLYATGFLAQPASELPAADDPAAAVQSVLLITLEQLLAIQALTLRDAMAEASDLVAGAMGSEKVDAFLYEPENDSLVALGTSDTEMSREQIRLGLDRRPLSEKDGLIDVFKTGKTFYTGDARNDPAAPRGEVEGLGIQSMVAAPLIVNGEIRGVLAAASSHPGRFNGPEQEFFHSVSRGVGMLAHRAELHEEMTRRAADEARRLAAEEMLAVASHDLRNQVTAVKGRIDLVLRRLRREENERDTAEMLEASAALDRLQRLIANLLDVSRLEGGIFSVNRQRTDLMDLVRRSVETVRLSRDTITIRGPQQLILPVDPVGIMQMLDNLVANAIGHTPPGTPVTISVTTRQEDEGEFAVVDVHDQGPGIDPDILPRLFARHVTGAGSTGLGIGLYLSRGIAEAHGGTLTASSRPGEGTTFEVLLPLEERAPAH